MPTIHLCLSCVAPHPDLHSFPTRRSSDLGKSLSWPVTWLPSTRPAAICSITKTPTVLLIARLPISCQRSEEHTSELQSHSDLVCRLLLEKKKSQSTQHTTQVSRCASSCSQ